MHQPLQEIFTMLSPSEGLDYQTRTLVHLLQDHLGLDLTITVKFGLLNVISVSFIYFISFFSHTNSLVNILQRKM